jgi:hypothetical protein
MFINHHPQLRNGVPQLILKDTGPRAVPAAWTLSCAVKPSTTSSSCAAPCHVLLRAAGRGCRWGLLLLLPHAAAATARLAAAAAQAVWPLFACLPLLSALHALLLCWKRVTPGPEPIAVAPRQFPEAATVLSIEPLHALRSGAIASSLSCVASLRSSPAGPSATLTYSMCCCRRSPSASYRRLPLPSSTIFR